MTSAKSVRGVRHGSNRRTHQPSPLPEEATAQGVYVSEGVREVQRQGGVQTVRKFRPSNGLEGDMFMERNCDRCAKDDPEKGIECPLIAASMAYEIDDPRYPVEWQGEFADPRTWVCTAREIRV